MGFRTCESCSFNDVQNIDMVKWRKGTKRKKSLNTHPRNRVNLYKLSSLTPEISYHEKRLRWWPWGRRGWWIDWNCCIKTYVLGLKIIVQWSIKANRGEEVKTRNLIRSLSKIKSKSKKKSDLQFPLLKKKSYPDSYISSHVQGLSFVLSSHSCLR